MRLSVGKYIITGSETNNQVYFHTFIRNRLYQRMEMGKMDVII